MKHLRLIVLAFAVIAAGATACFKDPTSSLRNGPSRIELTRSSMVLKVGDSLSVQAVVKDDQGNTYDAGDAAWTVDVAAIAAVRKDTTVVIPFNAYTLGFVRGVAAAGGVAIVTVTSHGLTNTVRVVILPTALTASAAVTVTGTAHADTIPHALPAVNDVFSAGDTLVFTTLAGSNLTFNTTGATASTVTLGTQKAYIVSRTANVVKAIAPGGVGFDGHPWVTGLTFTGTTAVGTIALDSLRSDSIRVSKPRNYGTITQVGDTMFLNAQTGSTFSITAPLSTVSFGAATAVLLASSATQLKVISPVAWTGVVTVTNVKVGSATLASVSTPVAYTINQAAFGGTVTTAGKLLDTVFVRGTAITKLDSGSVVTIGNSPVWVLKKFVSATTTACPANACLDSLYAIAKLPSAAPATVSRVNVGGTIIPQLATAGNVTITDAQPTGDPNVPGVYTPGNVFINFLANTAANPFVQFGAIDDAVNYDNYYSYTLSATRTVHIQLYFAGTAPSAGTAANPDLDMYLCSAAGCEVATYPTGFLDLSGGTSSNPEAMTFTNQAAGTYVIYVNGYSTGGKFRPYRLVAW